MGILKRNRLKAQLILVEIVVGLLLITAGIWYHQHDLHSTRIEKYNNLQAIANLKAKQLTQWHKERLSEATFFTKTEPNAELAGKIARGDTTLHNAYRNSLLQIMTNKRYRNIFMLNDNGAVIFSVYPTDNIIKDSITTHFAKKAYQTKETLITDFYWCNFHKAIHFDIIAPVLDLNQNVLSTLVFRIKPDDFLFPLLSDIPTDSETTETYIVRREGDSVLYLNELRHKANSAMKTKESLSNKENTAVRAVSGYEGFIEAYDYRGVKVLSDIRVVEGTSWYILSEIDASEAYHDLHQRTRLLSMLILLTILFVGAGMAWFYHYRQRNIYRELYRNKRLLHESQAKLKATLYSIGDGVITTDLDGKVMQLNKMAEKLTGWTEREAQGKKADEVFKLINEDTLESIQSPVNKVLKDGRIVGLANHTLLVQKNGEHLPISDNGAPIKDETGELQGVVMVFSDQSEVKRKESDLKESEERYRLVLDNSLDAILLTKPNGEILSANKAACTMFGMTEQEICEAGRGAIVDTDDEQLAQLLKKRDEDGSVQGELTFKRKSGERFPAEFTSSVFSDSKGEKRTSLIIRDISHRKKSEQIIREERLLLRTIIDNMPDAI